MNKKITFIFLLLIMLLPMVSGSNKKDLFNSYDEMKELDLNSDNMISFEEFKHNYLVKKQKSEIEIIIKEFKMYDKNFNAIGENFITLDDFNATTKNPIGEGLKLMLIGMVVVFSFLIIMVIVMIISAAVIKFVNKIVPEVEDMPHGNVTNSGDDHEDIAVVLAVIKSYTK